MLQANLRFLHQEQNTTPYCLISVLRISDLQASILDKATKGCEVISLRPDDTCLGLLQGIKCEITLVLTGHVIHPEKSTAVGDN